MSDHFAYGHTLQPEEILSDSDDHDDLEDLFNIGANKIEKPLRRHEE